MNRNPLADRPFTFAAQFFREPHRPLAELKRDMRAVKALGLNTIKIQEAWSYEEPDEGKYDFRLMDELATEAGRNGLQLFFTICLEAPAWAWKKYPDARIVNEEGKPLTSTNAYGYTDGKPGPCWNHPGMRETARRFLAAFAKRLGRHTNIVLWQAYQELNWWRTSVECYCPRCLARYRTWLKAQYGTLAALSAAWMIPVRDWADIEPLRPRGGPAYADWWRFTRGQAMLMLKWRADTLRANDPGHRPVSVNVSGPHFGQEWDWRLAENAEISGVSFYPTYFHLAPIPGPEPKPFPDRRTLLPHDLWHTCLWFDSIRVAARGHPWASEFQGGPAGGGMHHGVDPTAGDMRRWLFLALSSGIRGVSFWNHRPEFYGGEAHRYGIFGRDLAPSAKSREIGAIANAVGRHEALFKTGRLADVETAILVNDDTARHLEINNLTPVGVKSVCGLYRTLWAMGEHADFVAFSDLAAGRARAYKALFLPFAPALSDAHAGLLKRHVEEGGTLISEACPGRWSDRDMANLETGFAPGLDAVFGCRDGVLRMCVEQDGEFYNKGYRPYNWPEEYIGPLHLKGTGAFRGIALPASFYVETFDLTTGRPIFTHEGKPAGVVNRLGKGTAYLFGTFPSVAMMHAARDRGLEKTLQVIFARSKIRGNRRGKLILRRLTSPSGEVWFLINPTDKPVAQRLAFPRGAAVETLVEGTRIGKRVVVPAFSVGAFVVRSKGDWRT